MVHRPFGRFCSIPSSRCIAVEGKGKQGSFGEGTQTIVNRHEVLRTVIREHEGTPYQEIKGVDGWRLHFVEGSAYSGNESGLDSTLIP